MRQSREGVAGSQAWRRRVKGESVSLKRLVFVRFGEIDGFCVRYRG